jgi:predicted DNA-binding transcriptional regulator YafY
MAFERSHEIEQRLDHVLRLIRTRKFSTPMLAEHVGVSIPTISRIVAALRSRGHHIHAERKAGGWRYVLRHAAMSARTGSPPQLSRNSNERMPVEAERHPA